MSKRRFIVAIDELTEQEESTFAEYLKKSDLSWWHWINGFWLLVDEEEKLCAADIRSEIKKIAPGKTTIVIQTGNMKDWTIAGFGPIEPTINVTRWLDTVWRDK